MQDIISRTLRSVISGFIGDGVCFRGQRFTIQAIPSDNNFLILAGSALVSGIEVINPWRHDLHLSTRRSPATHHSPGHPCHSNRYRLSGHLAGRNKWSARPSVAQQRRCRTTDFRAAENGLGGAGRRERHLGAIAHTGHSHFPLARFIRLASIVLILASMITDLRKQIFSLAQLDDRLRIVAGPSFAASPNQFSPKTGAAGTNITDFVRIHARWVMVRFQSVNSRGLPVTANIITGPTDTQVVVAVPAMPGLTPGPFKITVNTIFGEKTSDDTFNAL